MAQGAAGMIVQKPECLHRNLETYLAPNGELRYRCRLCGQVFAPDESEDDVGAWM